MFRLRDQIPQNILFCSTKHIHVQNFFDFLHDFICSKGFLTFLISFYSIFNHNIIIFFIIISIFIFIFIIHIFMIIFIIHIFIIMFRRLIGRKFRRTIEQFRKLKEFRMGKDKGSLFLEHIWHEEMKEGEKLGEIVLQWGAGQKKSVLGSDLEQLPVALRKEILDDVGFVQHHTAKLDFLEK